MTNDDHITGNMDDFIRQGIRSHGHAIIGVFGHGPKPPFTYSVGLSPDFGFEIILVGLRNEYAAQIINDVAEALRDNQTIVLDEPDHRFGNLPCMFRKCGEKVRNYAVQADRFFNQTTEVYQFVMPDRDGNFPEDRSYDRAYMGPRQTLLY